MNISNFFLNCKKRRQGFGKIKNKLGAPTSNIIFKLLLNYICVICNYKSTTT